MMSNDTNTVPQGKGPVAYENWRVAVAGVPSEDAFEYPLFTDAHIIGGINHKYGPYELINAVPYGRAHTSRPTIVLRVQYHLYNVTISMDKTDVEYYHGGYLADEVAALVSLCLGMRLKAGDRTRVFGPRDDPRGRPISSGAEPNPVLPKLVDRPIVPGLLGTHVLEDVAILSQFPVLSSQEAIALVRAARLYQEAMWSVDATPELSWLMLTSAIETAANVWRATQEPALDRLRASKPSLEKLLREKCGEEAVLQVAEEIAPYMGLTKKFIDFILSFLPLAPTVRPIEYFQFPWTRAAMKKAMNQIYNYRSRALHDGIPFPAPMCEPASYLDENNVPAEIVMPKLLAPQRPTVGAVSAPGGVWRSEDLPMTLHTFEYIARHSLLNWWKSLAATKAVADIVEEGAE